MKNTKEYMRQWRLDNPDKMQSYRKVFNEYRKKWQKEWTMKNPERTILRKTKVKAKRYHQEFNLTREDIIIPEYCPYLGIKLEIQNRVSNLDSLASIDRIDNSKGYIKGNIQIISYKANRCKNNLTLPELKLFAQNVLRIHQ
jgi:hypothetical protein